MSLAHRPAPILLFLLLVSAYPGCTSTSTQPLTVSSPKIYLDDRVLRTLDERKKALNDVVKNIQEKDVQEVAGVRQASKTTMVIRGQETSDTIVKAPDAIQTTEVALPAAPAASDRIGLPFQSLLKKVTLRDQLITGLQLLYGGDIDILDPQRRLILVRFDVSINDYIPGKSFFSNDTQFLTLGFSVGTDSDICKLKRQETNEHEKGKNNPNPQGEGRQKPDEMPLKQGQCDPDYERSREARIYTLMPDYSSIVSQESFVNATLEHLAAQAAGKSGTTSLQGVLDFQRALEESLQSVVEQPLQFAIYSNTDGKFGFAFGPRRHIQKRSWISAHPGLIQKKRCLHHWA